MTVHSIAVRVGVALLALALLVVWLLRPPAALPARFAQADCRVLDVLDPRTRRPVVGAEDLALAPDGDRLIFSAYDRRAPGPPPGGLYGFSLWELAGQRSVRAERLDEPGRDRPFRPHGIAISPDGARLAVINRVGRDEAVIEIGPLGPTWRPDRVVSAPGLCRANDLAFDGPGRDELLVTLDRAECGSSLADLLPFAATGRLARTSGQAVTIERTGLAFANGLAAGLVAETRADRLSRADGSAIDLPGGPDNLTEAPGGGLVVALHPKLLHLWLALAGWRDRAPSRIALVDPARGSVEVLFDDPEGARFSAATTGILVEGRLFAGSVMDRGLLLCGDGP